MRMPSKDELKGLKAITLYRVSSDQQDEDLQKKACKDFCTEYGVELIDEYLEIDVSGFKTPLAERTKLLKILNRATYDKDFQILIVFMQDRIGRRQDETPSVIQDLSRNNVRCFESSTFQELEVESHEGKLINYVNSWTSELESIKTSLRVKEKMAVLNEEGGYVGGTPPFGYRTYYTGEVNKRGKAVRELEIDEDEAEIVKLIFELYTQHGMGTTGVCNYLNENYPNSSRTGKKFTPTVIHRMLQNKVYIGYKMYNKEKTTRDKKIKLTKDNWKTQPYSEKLRILNDDIFNEAQKLMKLRKREKDGHVKTTTMSKNALCSGLVYCKCGTKMKVGYSESPYIRQDGVHVPNRVYYYYCPISRWDKKAHFKISKQRSLSVRKVDPYIDEYIQNFLDNFNEENYIQSLQGQKNNDIKKQEKTLLLLEKDKKKKELLISKYEQLIDDYILKEDFDKIDIFTNNIKKNKLLINDIDIEIATLGHKIEHYKKQNIETKQTINRIINIRDKYKSLSLSERKNIVSLFIKKIIIVDDTLTIKSSLPEDFY